MQQLPENKDVRVVWGHVEKGAGRYTSLLGRSPALGNANEVCGTWLSGDAVITLTSQMRDRIITK